MLKTSIISLIVYLNCLCSSELISKQLYDASTKSLSYFCSNYRGKESNDRSLPALLIDPLEVKHLKIGGCEEVIVSQAILIYQNIRSLDISYSDYVSLSAINLTTTQIEIFNASDNWFFSIPWFYFKQMPAVLEIDLSHNPLDRINSFDFEGANRLRRINLAHNQIKLISYSAFDNLTELEYVDLSWNQISYGIEAFRNNKQLKVLNLRHNPIWSLTCDYFLDITPMSVLISLDFIQVVNFTCSGDPIRVTRDSETEGIASTTNGRYEIRCSEKSFSNVHTFQAAQIQIENVAELLQHFTSSLATLSLSDTFVGNLNTETIQKLSNLQHLTLIRTNLSHFDLRMLQNHEQLATLDISYNNIKRFNHISLLDTFVHLKQFSAVENQFEHVDELIHRLPDSIEAIDLSGNFIGRINNELFSKFHNLLVLNLSNTSLSFGDSDPFQELLDLSIVDISDNNLNGLDFALLGGTLKHVGIFYATNCHIRNSTNLIEQFGSNLMRLYLSDNNAGDLNSGIFNGFIDLHHLHLDGTNLTHVPRDLFRKQNKLIELNLARNQIQTIDFMFVSIKLQALYLEDNELSDIRYLNRQRFPLLLTVNISGNRLPCQWLAEFIREWNGTFVGDPWLQTNNCRQ